MYVEAVLEYETCIGYKLRTVLERLHIDAKCLEQSSL